jgi:methyl-accepting chemotaxis protein
VKNWQDQKIGTRLGILLGAILLSGIVFGGVGLAWFTHLNSETLASIQKRYKTIELTRKTIANSITNARITIQLFETTDPQELANLNRQNDAISQEIGGQITAIEKCLSSSEERELFATVNRDRDAYKSARQKAKNLLADNKRDQGLAVLQQEVIPSLDQYRSSWERFIDLQTAAMQESMQRSQESYVMASWAAWLLLAITAILGPIAIINVTKSITVPIRQAVEQAERIAIGDLNQDIRVERQDELGELGPAFAKMIDYLKEMANCSEAIARGDLFVEVEPRSDLDTFGKAFRNMTQELREIVGSVRDSAAQVAAGSHQVAEASGDSAKLSLHAASAIDEVTSTMHEMSINVQNMVKNTQMQASSVSETSASIDQMVASNQRVADTSKVLLDISSRSRDEVQSGIGTMQKTTDGLNRINGSIGSSATIISSLGERVDNIGKIIEVIDDISEQTNLLALNAAIEAARAGEHGLGFAVVADEVRKLAEKSATSTKEISELISSIQSEARKAVDNMEKSTVIVNEGLELGNDLSLALRKISTVVTEVFKFAQEIGAATNEQSHGSSQIAQATSRLNEITHEITSSVEEQAGGAQAVVRAMERMREMVQNQTSGTTELAASSEQMSRMASNLMESMGRFAIDADRRPMELPATGQRKALAARQGARN